MLSGLLLVFVEILLLGEKICNGSVYVVFLMISKFLKGFYNICLCYSLLCDLSGVVFIIDEIDK